MIKCKYPLFQVNFMLGYVPADLHFFNLPYHVNMTKENFEDIAKEITKNGGNSTRLFLDTGEKEGDLDNFLHVFHRENNGKFELTEFGSDVDEIEWRLEKYWERDIYTVICIASGIKEGRFQHTVWHRQNNCNQTAGDYRFFMTHNETKRTYKQVLRMLWKRWKDKPVIFELINEPQAFSDLTLYNWYVNIFDFAIEVLEIPSNRLMFEKWDSSLILKLLDRYDCWMLEHGVNHTNWFKRFHTGEMQEIYEKYSWIAVDSDGAKKAEGNIPMLGEGLKGLTWNDDFRRSAPVHMKDGLIYDYKHKGKGWMIMSAGAYYKNCDGDKPNYSQWKHAAIDGLEKSECSLYGVDWSLFSYQKGLKREPLGELTAIRKAGRRLFE